MWSWVESGWDGQKKGSKGSEEVSRSSRYGKVTTPFVMWLKAVKF